MPFVGLVLLGATPRRGGAAGTAHWLFAAALALSLAEAVRARRSQIPLNRRIQSWDAACPPADWSAAWDAWGRGYALRQEAGLAAFALALAAATGSA